MSGLVSATDAPIDNKAQLAEYLAQGCKAPVDWRIGTEHEKFGYRLADLGGVAYDGPNGIRAILTGLKDRFGWEGIYEGDYLIALAKDGASVSLEPGGQLELSGAPLETIHQTCDEVHQHLAQVKQVADPLGVGFIGLGFHPLARRADVPVMPKGRYDIMRAYMPKRGALGLDMMLRTCTVQVNLDFQSESDMVKKLRVSLALQPIATALFANSPFTEGRPNGFQSYRAHIWSDTDPDRTGMLPFAFEDGMGFERYVDYALDVPMYFVHRDGRYIDASGQSFRDFMAGRLPALPGERATLRDFANHLTTIFPEVRLKQYLEMRGADSAPWCGLCALPALWVGLLYDDLALDAAWDLVKDWSAAERDQLRAEVPKGGMATPFRGRDVRHIAQQAVAIAHSGLRRRNRLSSSGSNETGFLLMLETAVARGLTPAQELLASYEGKWGGDIRKLFEEHSY